MRLILIFILITAISLNLNAQKENRSFNAERTSEIIKIDGKLDENIWQTNPHMNNFIQYVPVNGANPASKTEAWFYYNDIGVYVGIKCYENNTDSIFNELRVRDDAVGTNSDGVGVMLSPYNDGINFNYFKVSAANVQTDELYSGESSDRSWDAVWYSEVYHHDKGWNCEILIPYSALRFSKKDVQDWGINIWRHVARKQEWISWQYVNNENSFWWKYTGKVNGLKKLNPPVRLSLMPYVSSFIEKQTNKKRILDYNLGMDLKYGISQSITLDMTLIPDFKQVQSDDIELNLSPFEQFYNEKRQFFTEGMDLFKKGEIFYSRRIGSQPQKYSLLEDSVSGTEKIIKNPSETQLINSTKISGRTKTGLGFGLLNSMTKSAYAEIQDTLTSSTRDFLTQPFTNYNVAVLDKTLFSNSYISLINTNFFNSDYMSNVVASEVNFTNKESTYGVRGIGAYSYVNAESKSEGYKTFLKGGKIGGKIQLVYNLSLISDSYNQNYMGFMRNNNEFNQELEFKYKIVKPFSVFLNMSNEFKANYNRLFKPNLYSEFNMSYVLRTEFKNLYSFTMHAMWAPEEKHDFYETRTTGVFVNKGKWYHNCFSIKSNPTKTFYANIHYGFTNSYNYFLESKTRNHSFEPGLKLSDNLRINYRLYYRTEINTPGYVNADETTNNIYFGNRDRETLSNTIDFSYIFTNKMSVKLRVRHYWSKADYSEFYELFGRGDLTNTTYTDNHNINYNAFNIDMTYSWNFAPGSEFLVNWKSFTYSEDDVIVNRYFDNIESLMGDANTNRISFKLLYYLDYNTLKSRNKKKSNS